MTKPAPPSPLTFSPQRPNPNHCEEWGQQQGPHWAQADYLPRPQCCGGIWIPLLPLCSGCPFIHAAIFLGSLLFSIPIC